MHFSKTLLAAGLAVMLAASQSVAADKFGADRHVARGVSCEVCHGKDMNNLAYPDEKTCKHCHPKESVVKKTDALKPNPHAAPHNGDCTLCHMMHEPTENYCAQCHDFKFPSVP